MLTRKRVLLAKKEVTYGTDSTPTGAANAILVSNLSVVPMEMITRERNNVSETLGNVQSIPAGTTVRCSFEVEIAGSSGAGTAPPWGPLVEACAFGETIVPATSVTYDPISTAFPSLSIYYNMDGVRHKVLGSRGTRFGMRFPNLDLPKFLFEFQGIYQPVDDAALPAQTLTAWIQPLAFNNQNASAFSLHGYAGLLHSLEVDMALATAYRNVVGDEAVIITDRKPIANVVLDAVSVGTKNWWALAQASTLDALALTHGTVAGNIVSIAAPKTQIEQPGYGDADGIATWQARLKLMPDAGDDELSIVVT